MYIIIITILKIIMIIKLLNYKQKVEAIVILQNKQVR